MEIPQKLKIELPFDPAIPLLGIYPEKTMTRKDACIPMFIAALFTIAKTWKQPKCPSIEEWIQKMGYIYTMEYYSAIKKNEILAFFTAWMELETLTVSEVREGQIPYVTCIWNPIYSTNEPFHRKENHGLSE